MAAITNQRDETFESLTAGADLDGQGSWAKMAGSGTTDLFVIANTTLEGSQCIAVRNAAAAQTIGYERTLATARVADTDFWRITAKVRIEAAAVAAEKMWLTLSAGAGSIFAGIDGNNALAIAFDRVSTNIFAYYADNSSAGFQAISTALAAQAVTAAIRIDIHENDDYSLWLDADDDGEGWVLIRSGTLKAGNEAISRISVQTNAPTSGDDLLLMDKITVSAIVAETKVSFDERVTRMGQVAPGGAVLNGAMVDMTVEYYDMMTGSLVTTRTVTIPVSYLSPAGGASAADLIDKAIEDAAVQYDAEARVAALAASGHNKGF